MISKRIQLSKQIIEPKGQDTQRPVGLMTLFLKQIKNQISKIFWLETGMAQAVKPSDAFIAKHAGQGGDGLGPGCLEERIEHNHVQEFSKLGGSSAYDLVQRQKQAFRAPPKRLKTPSKIGLEERLIDKIQKNKFKYI
ncbi:hypothetical protein HUJ04_003261 [Dendroctonus ponderosae]|nr:hypothetical protein HUJ04_003261 [Dendroctonus ponderosae]